MKKVTVIIPCYNEEAGIGDVIRGFPEELMLARGYTLEVLVIDNNSADNTSAVARAAGARVIFEGKQGKGHAIRTGFKSVSPDTDYVVMLDGDHTYEPGEILRMIEPLESGFSNVIIGSRLSGRMAFGSMKSFNRLGNWMYSVYLPRLRHRRTHRLLCLDPRSGRKDAPAPEVARLCH
jgi:glycosyltransferase involved in cell wall biosynthesis